MMHSSVVLLLVLLGSLVVDGQQQEDGDVQPPGGYYKTRYDHLDVENVLNQKRLVQYYAACLLGKGPCTPQGIEFRQILPEAIATNCLRCTEKQRFVINRTVRRLRKEYPDIWRELQAMWDPTGERVKTLEESFNSRPPSGTSINARPSNSLPSSSAGTIATVPSTVAAPAVVVTSQTTTRTTTTRRPSTSSLDVLDTNNLLADRFGSESEISSNSVPDPSSTSIILTALTNGATLDGGGSGSTVTNTNNNRPSSTNTRATQTTSRTFIPLSLPPTEATSFAGQPSIAQSGLPTLKPISFANNAVSSILLQSPLSTLTSIGSKVVETGTKIAGAVFDTVQNVVGIQIPKVRIF